MLVIKQLELRNFMCHKHLQLKFSKKLTMISGLNGSGKSSVMIAIGLLFGQRVNKLDRGASYKELIKTGEKECSIRAILDNSTIKYHNEFFGNEITIEKKFRIIINNKNTLKDIEHENVAINANIDYGNASSNFKTSTSLVIYNSNNKIFSKKNSDLEKLMNYFLLQLENPINFLTQDFSKKFLNISNPSHLYHFFMKGTELEDIKLLHEQAQINADEMNLQIKVINEEIKELRKKIRNHEESLTNLLKIRDFESEIEKLEIEKGWCNIDFNGFLNIETIVSSKNAKVESLIAEITRLGSELKDLTERKNDIVTENNALRIKLTGEIKNLKQENEDLEKEKREVENDINEIQRANSETQSKIFDLEKSKKVEDIQNLQDKILNEENNLQQSVQLKEDIEKEIENYSKMFHQRSEEIEKTKNDLNMLNKQIEDNRRIKQNRLTYFGPQMPAFLEELRRMKFKGVVIGPIANEIKLREFKWYKPVSIILHKFLGSIIVHNRDDRLRIIDLMRKHRLNISLFVPSSISNTQINYKTNSRYTTVLNVLEIPNNIVKNQLIILTSLEQIILVENREDAYKILKNNPENVEMAFTISGDTIKKYQNSLTDFSHTKK
ncbi:hypothetical protein EDEG_00393 [Edhazardia aedis USNM 41457]|uniref:Rad50/SbcC-type AAA domain-containing protein n=1 Tax=Edhazardia aedis (strain USNM 41457) TaxID=1003232 RepID=J9D1G4_EDHAE|nr:hypothetical protein EDEG_00393 [Edhazardia aedis USNM 41457]|eukprot:EJW01676.1 hypothetical protein EDEG_00393 [Edhazardia aedis USNM 41457]